MQVRNYKKSDYDMIRSWWKDANECPPTPDMMPEDSSFVLEKDGKALVCITLYLTNSCEFALIDNLVANKKFEQNTKEAVNFLVKHVERFAKEKGYKKLFCMAMNDKLARRYQDMGYFQTADNVHTFIKGV